MLNHDKYSDFARKSVERIFLCVRGLRELRAAKGEYAFQANGCDSMIYMPPERGRSHDANEDLCEKYVKKVS